MIRALTLALAIGGAALGSQAPEFAQQYVQRLSGMVAALGEVVADFDASATRAGLSREDALAELTGTAFLDARQGDMRVAIERHTRLSADLAHLTQVAGLERLANPLRLSDPEIVRATWGDFKPAVPLTKDGLTAAALGGVGTWICLGTLLWGIAKIAAPRRARVRIEPTLTGERR